MVDLRKLLLAWLALPLTGLDWWIAWDRLPARVVMKTDGNGRAIGWALREDALEFDLVLLTGILFFMTAIGAIAIFGRPEKANQVTLILLGTSVFIFLVFNGILWGIQVPY